ncbi:hypothetical protein LOD99_7959 [Oopsacas minuta]|uniref:RRM domain-containing protein n=1 Tax=Oopsacas minuta TaxID=111878 RepID=A0AAV7JI48_9METZ|nr:hypothetical protein LOD99_7959 [Oopsacas minuta]
MRDSDTGISKGIAFINFASFDASDSAMEALNGQFLSNRAIRVSYSFKKDGKGERHGTASERLLASKQPVIGDDKPHQNFSDTPVIHEFISSHLPHIFSSHNHGNFSIAETLYRTSTNMTSPTPSIMPFRPLSHQDAQYTFPLKQPTLNFGQEHKDDIYGINTEQFDPPSLYQQVY